MVINIIMVIAAFTFIGLAILAWCICSVNPPDPRDDEEQILYINDWNKKQGMWWYEKKQKTKDSNET